MVTPPWSTQKHKKYGNYHAYISLYIMYLHSIIGLKRKQDGRTVWTLNGLLTPEMLDIRNFHKIKTSRTPGTYS